MYPGPDKWMKLFRADEIVSADEMKYNSAAKHSNFVELFVIQEGGGFKFQLAASWTTTSSLEPQTLGVTVGFLKKPIEVNKWFHVAAVVNPSEVHVKMLSSFSACLLTPACASVPL